jgi:hypothetical protein
MRTELIILDVVHTDKSQNNTLRLLKANISRDKKKLCKRL